MSTEQGGVLATFASVSEEGVVYASGGRVVRIEEGRFVHVAFAGFPERCRIGDPAGYGSTGPLRFIDGVLLFTQRQSATFELREHGFVRACKGRRDCSQVGLVEIGGEPIVVAGTRRVRSAEGEWLDLGSEVARGIARQLRPELPPELRSAKRLNSRTGMYVVADQRVMSVSSQREPRVVAILDEGEQAKLVERCGSEHIVGLEGTGGLKVCSLDACRRLATGAVTALDINAGHGVVVIDHEVFGFECEG